MTASFRPFPIVLTAPSGAGKTTIARALVSRRADLVFALSATTRSPREGERDGVDYRFVDDGVFDELRRTGELLECAEVHGRWYGTLRASVIEALDAGKVVVLDIDVQGARKIRDMFPDAVPIFILPPSPATWVERLTGRGSESKEERQVRMGTALKELRAVAEFEYVVINDDLDHALQSIGAIVEAERRRPARTNELDARIRALEAVLEQHMEAEII